ncbi:hypothetical protein EXIGLDRAFT_684196 [Exidia glandulosa HHB12029]|uniref:GATA-type domain-containing protein n=1 Tax=Exidia glandulosa HHB12029 TaxID=1314781 RepID=A0A165CU90_EXIGL|nr:hypothetical protein EXIGLDRAFT_684196 [Exidia glandulosa HHB12029]
MYHHHHPARPLNGRARYLQPQPASSSSQAKSLPRVGQTRCYWALLSHELEFLFLDPVLAHHLGPQKDGLMGRSLLEFVHPDERDSAANDLAGVLESKTLHGSVTRMRYCRLSKIRKLLGFKGVPDVPPVMTPVFYDDSYMACDLVINLASDGLVLCFIHAVVDITPQDNDEVQRTEWTNWCGTLAGGIAPDLASFLHHQLDRILAPRNGNPYDRVFQILDNAQERAVVFSWPPEVNREDYARLAHDIQMQFNPPPGESDVKHAPDNGAKTSCTRRYKAQQWLVFRDGLEREVESIFIPYGCIIFACHKTVNVRTPSQPPAQQQPQNMQQQQQFYFEHPQGQSVFANNGAMEPWANAFPQPAASGSAQWANQPLPNPTLPFPPGSNNTLDGTASPESPTHSTVSAASSGSLLPDVPAPRPKNDDGATGSGGGRSGGGRSAGGNPPSGVTKCSNCSIKSSPEWRKGPSGKKDLCNACGLRFARSRAKREGHPIQRRKKDKEGAAGPSRTKKSNSPARVPSAASSSSAVSKSDPPQQWLDPALAFAASNPMLAAAAAAAQGYLPPAPQDAYHFQQQQQQAQMYGQQFQQQQQHHPHQALNLLSSASFERAAAAEQEKAGGGNSGQHDKSPGPPVYVQ